MKFKTNKNFAFSHKKVCHFGSCVAKAKLFCLKRLVSGTQAGVLISENFHPGYRDLGRRNRDLGNRASPASHMNTSEYLRRKEWRAEVSDPEPARLTAGSYEETSFLPGSNRVKFVGTSACRTLADFLWRLTAFSLGAESISAMFEKRLVNVTLIG